MAELENLRIRVEPELNRRLDEFIEKKLISKQDTVNGLLAWFVAQDGMLQSLILGQIDEEYRNQAARMILEKMTAPPKRVSPRDVDEEFKRRRKTAG